jgi:PAS domain S-box-containing protein
VSEPHPDELRRRAEEQLAAHDNQVKTLERADLVSLAHELAVHQIELEIQNEELLRSRTLAEEARDRYLDLYDFAPVGYFTLDAHNRIVEANLAGCRLLNTERHRLLQTGFTKFLRDGEADKFYFYRKKVLESGGRQTCELKMRRVDDAPFDARLESIRVGAGRLRVAVMDVTERTRAEEALRDLNAALESKVAQRTAELRHRARQLQKLTLDMSVAEDRERERIAHILHDDLQQELAAAKFHLSLVRSRVKQDSSLQEIVAQIDQMLKDAIEKSRSLSRDLSPGVLRHDDFADALRGLADEMRAKHGLIIHVHAQGPVYSPSDAIKVFLYKTAQELLFNVVKHARVNEAGIRVGRTGRYLCLLVSDRGRGFDPQGLREAAGSGLLSIQERIELLGGRMKIKSAPGRGSAFSIVVPDGESVIVPPLSGATATQPGATAPQAQNRLRVLLADDHKIVREGLRSLLRDQPDVEIVGEATNGREAVDLANQLQPDVVIVDVLMPVMSGEETARQIKRDLPGTRIVALSMREEPEIRERMCQAGAESYVLKTAPYKELLAAIRGNGREA